MMKVFRLEINVNHILEFDTDSKQVKIDKINEIQKLYSYP